MRILPVEPAYFALTRRLPRLATIRARVLAAVLLTMLPAFVLVVVNEMDERMRGVEFTRQGALSTARLIAAEQSQLIANARQVMQVIANSDHPINEGSKSCENYLTRIYETTEGFRGFSIARPNGDVYCSAPHLATPPLDTAQQSYFRKVLATRGFAIGDAGAGQTEASDLSFGYPIFDDLGGISGVLWAAWSVDRINDLTANWQLPAGTSVVLMDNQGTVVSNFPRREDWVGKRFADSQLYDHMMRSTEGPIRLPGLDGVERWFAFTTVGGSSDSPGEPASTAAARLYLAVGYSDAALTDDIDRHLLLSLSALSVLSAVALAVSYAMTDWMIGRRARHIMATTRALQRGNWRARTNMTQHDGELGELGRTLDEMADALQQRDRSLQRINNELETRVAARTAELATANGQLQASQDQLRRLSQELLDITEQERARVADDVSERLGQGLTGIKMDLTLAQRDMRLRREEAALAHVRAAIGTLDGAVATARQIARGLRPSVLDDFGLTAAVEGQLADFESLSGIETHLDAAVDETRLSSATGTAAFRVLQEALSNVALHARANAVWVVMRTDRNVLSLRVQDNGEGFVPGDLLKPRATGVLGMRERANQHGGVLEVSATPGQGTTVTLALPLAVEVISESLAQ